MSNQNNKKKNLIALIGMIAICYYPFVNFAYENRDDYIEIWLLLKYATLIMIVIVAFCFLLAILTKRPFFNIALPMMPFVFCFFSFHSFEQLTANILTSSIALFAVWVPAVCLLCWAVWRYAHHEKLLQFICVLSLLLMLQPVVGYLAHSVSSGAEARSADEIDSSADQGAASQQFASNRNVYFFLIDTYARADTLKDIFNYDNTPFLNSLRGRGFFVAEKSTVNYPWTSLSIPSMLEMDYFQESRSIDIMRGDNLAVRRFKAAGYSYVLAPAGVWQKVVCSGKEDLCIGKSSPLEMERALLQMTPLHRFPLPEKFEKYSHRTPEDFLEPEDVSERLVNLPHPSFVFVHFGGVHDQIYDRDCNYQNPSSPRIHNQKKVDGFVSATRCMNDLMNPMIDTIIERDPDAIIILQSDHGPSVGLHLSEEEKKLDPPNWEMVTQRDFRNKFGVLTAIRAPAKCQEWMQDDISGVNILRIVFACLEEREPSLLETVHYFKTRKTPLRQLFPEKLPPG